MVIRESHVEGITIGYLNIGKKKEGYKPLGTWILIVIST